MEFLELIKAELKKQGLFEGMAILITVESESEIEAKVADLKSKVGSKDGLSEVLKGIGLDSNFNNIMQSETDRRVTQAMKKAKKDQDDGKDNDDNKSKTDPPDTSSKTDELTPEQKEIASLKDMVTKLTGLVKGQVEQAAKGKITEAARTALKKAGLPEAWASRVNVEKIEDIEEAVTGLKTEYDEILQTAIDAKLEENGIPQGSGKTDLGKAQIDSYLKDTAETNVGMKVQEL